jgi:two-component system response regulator QseB
MENKPRILIVEEDVVLAGTLSSVLKTNGYDVATAQDSEKAIKHIRMRPVELVFIDSKIFVMSGVETYERITEIRPKAEIVVMMDSHLSQGPAKEIIEQGLWAPLCKPFGVEELLAVIEDSMKFKTAALFIPVVQQHLECVPNQKAA